MLMLMLQLILNFKNQIRELILERIPLGDSKRGWFYTKLRKYDSGASMISQIHGIFE